jgi:hypothetical protein
VVDGHERAHAVGRDVQAEPVGPEELRLAGEGRVGQQRGLAEVDAHDGALHRGGALHDGLAVEVGQVRVPPLPVDGDVLGAGVQRQGLAVAREVGLDLFEGAAPAEDPDGAEDRKDHDQPDAKQYPLDEFLHGP